MLSDKEIIEHLDISKERTYEHDGQKLTTADVYPLLEYALAEGEKRGREQERKSIGEWLRKQRGIEVKYPFKNKEIGIDLLPGENGVILYLDIDKLGETINYLVNGQSLSEERTE